MHFIIIVSLLCHFLNDYVQCGEVNILNAVNIRWENQGAQTMFWATASLPSTIDPNFAWFGVGINSHHEMVLVLPF